MADIAEKHFDIGSKITIFFLIICVITSFFAYFSFVKSKDVSFATGNNTAIVIEQDSGRVLYSDNENTPLPIASTTKILTALTVIDSVQNLDEIVKIPKQAVGIEGSSIYLKEGENLTYRELLYGLMLRSGNDAAVALAIATSGSVNNFVRHMNNKAVECGALNCTFTNPHGLHEDSHLCTAAGLAKITAVALSRDDFKQIVSTKFIKISGEPERYLSNKNKMLTMFEGANGVKTGYTKKSGRCLVSSAERDGMQLIAVVINHGNMWNDSINMLNNAFSTYKMRVLSDGQPILINVENGSYKCVYAKSQLFSYPLTDDEYKRIKIDIDLAKSMKAPVKKGENVGKISVYLDERLLFSSNFNTITSIKKKGLLK